VPEPAVHRSQLFTQNSPGCPGGVEFDDFFGEALVASVP
jgi:hypothetical protein